jgi:hypothetical protein
MKHKWWHFIYGTEILSEIVSKSKNVQTSNYWEVCKKCKKQIGEKQGATTFSITLDLTVD